MSVCLRYTSDRDEAAFVLNQAFFKIFKELKRFSSGKGSIKTWMYRITVNTAIDHYRKEMRSFLTKEGIEEKENSLLTLDDPISDLSAQEIIGLIQDLSPAYKLVFNLFVVEGYSHQEIADKLNITVGSSKSNLAKAKRNMKKLWFERNKIIRYGNQ